jgi:hypothetical protein
MTRAFIAGSARGNLCTSRQESASLALCVAGLAALLTYSASAWAGDTVTVKLRGEVPAHCSVHGIDAGVASLRTVSLEDITKQGHADYLFRVTCNAPFEYSLEAKHGALTNMNASPSGFANTVPYGVQVNIPNDERAISDRCPGEALREGNVRCHFSNSGNGIAFNGQASVSMSWNPSGLPLTGQYIDTLTFNIGPKK